MRLPPYATPMQHLQRAVYLTACALIFAFLVAPTFVVVPLSFSSEPFFTFPIPGFSMRWYDDFFGSERWQVSIVNSVIVACATTALATVLGTVAALGLSRRSFPFKTLTMAILISPMIVPVVVTAVGAYTFYAGLGLSNTRIGLILAHTALATPFVVIAVTATLSGYDRTLTRAAASSGASPWVTFRRVTLPMILPGIVSGALFAFGTSFDEVVVALFLVRAEQRTLPMQMFSGIRDQINPTIMAAATILIVISVALLATIEALRRRSERLRGITPG